MSRPSGGKEMSSRLMNMKFMQRGAAAQSKSAPSTPMGPPVKRQRLSHGAAREAANRGDTKWYLSFQKPQAPAAESPLRIVSAGYATLDAPEHVAVKEELEGDYEDGEDEELSPPQLPGRKSFGKFNHKIEKQQNPGLSSSAESESDDSDEEEDIGDDPTGTKALIAQGRKAKKQASEAKLKQSAADRRRKEVNLNTITSISGRGQAGGRIDYLAKMECHQCHEKGHMARECPQNPRNIRKATVAEPQPYTLEHLVTQGLWNEK